MFDQDLKVWYRDLFFPTSTVRRASASADGWAASQETGQKPALLGAQTAACSTWGGDQRLNEHDPASTAC